MDLMHEVDDEVSLRLMEARHAEELYALIDANRDALRPWMSWPPQVQSVDEVREKLREWSHAFADTGAAVFGIVVDERLSGLVFQLFPDSRHRLVELGYWLGAHARGRGVATRAVGAATRDSFKRLGMHRVWLRIAMTNVASRGVAERAGFVFEGVMRQALRVDEAFCDAGLYSRLATDEGGTA